jgi:hypothetical protein
LSLHVTRDALFARAGDARFSINDLEDLGLSTGL